MNRLILFPSLLLLCVLAGCGHESASVTICLLDTSKSIDPAAIQEEFAAVERLVDGMHRGDTLIVIPITGNAHNDVQGHILQLGAPSRRESFDADMAAFQKAAHQQVAPLAAWAVANPSNRTDILGTLRVAEQEADCRNRGAVRAVVLSDFIEDDGAVNFAKDPRLASADKARHFADEMAKTEGFSFGGSIYLGRIRGNDRVLSRTRQDAVDAFWDEFFSTPGHHVDIHDDGIDALGELETEQRGEAR